MSTVTSSPQSCYHSTLFNNNNNNNNNNNDDNTTLHFEKFFSDDFSKICVIESLFYVDSRNDFHFYPSRQVFTQNRSICFTVVINLSTNTETTFHTRNKMFFGKYMSNMLLRTVLIIPSLLYNKTKEKK
jgi:hypothetical protein